MTILNREIENEEIYFEEIGKHFDKRAARMLLRKISDER